MDLLQLLKCATGSHHRSRHLAWFDGETYRSWCTGCNRPMIRLGGHWANDPNPIPPPSDHSRAKKVT